MNFANTNILAAKQRLPLSTQEKVTNELWQCDNMIDLVNILFVRSWGCFHLRCQWLLFSKSNSRPLSAFREVHRYFHTQCFVCTKQYINYMLPVVSI